MILNKIKDIITDMYLTNVSQEDRDKIAEKIYSILRRDGLLKEEK